jgi:hypothetical protein
LYEFIDILKECTASIFGVEKLAKQVTKHSFCLLVAGYLLCLLFDSEDEVSLYRAMDHYTPEDGTVRR